MRPRFLVRCLPVLLLAAALLTGTPLAAQPALTGPEMFIGTPDPMAYLEGSTAATDADGRPMVVWIESLQGQSRLRGRVFAASGRSERPAFTLDTGTHPVVNATLAPAVPDGFLLAWQTSEKIGQAERRRLLARRLSPSGRPCGDVVQIRGPVLIAHGFPAIGSMQTASAPDGSFVVAWDETNPRTRRIDVFLRRFDTAGRPLARAALLPGEGGNRERSISALAVLDDGQIRIAWRSRLSEGDGTGVYARAFNAAGAPRSDEIPVNSGTEGDQGAPSIALTGDGRFAVLWQSPSEESSRVSGQLFAGDGSRLGIEAQIAPDAETPAVAWSDQGFFVAVLFFRGTYGGDSDEDYIAACRLPL